MDHYGNADNGRSHAPVPFFISSKGYGVFINSARYLDVYVGVGVRKDSKHPPKIYDRNRDKKWSAQPYSDNLEILVPAQGVELVVFSGASMLEVVQKFNLYNGGGVLPPKWGLGFWQRVPTGFTDREVLEEVAAFKKRGFPLSVIGLEPGWMSASYPCTYDWDSIRFPDPKGFISKLTAQGIKTNAWMNPGMSPASSIYAKMEPYTASHTEWCGVIPDYTLKEAKDLMANHLKDKVIKAGVSGFKMDENDGYDNWLWPDVAVFPSGVSAEQMRQLYGSLQQRMTMDVFHQMNQRTYGLVRAANAGTSSFPYVLYNDYYEHRDFITALINSSFIGVLWTPEVRASKTSEEWLRRMQTVCFSPLAMLNAWSDGTKPWSFPDVADDVKAIAQLRMQLLPYLYTAFADYHFKGIPPMRAMNLEEGYGWETIMEAGKLDATANPYAMALKRESKDQFMVGPSLLVAPLFAGEVTRKVVLPRGRWYDFYTGNYVGDGEVITVSPGLSRIPVFVKDGGIVPMYLESKDDFTQKQVLEIRHYGNQPGSYDLYDDDGISYEYEKGACVRIALKVVKESNGKKQGTVQLPNGKTIWSYSDFRFKFMTYRD
jgi:alpha-D-xyloside xylohydrolase